MLLPGPAECFFTVWPTKLHSLLPVSSFHSVSLSPGLCPWISASSYPKAVILSSRKVHTTVHFFLRDSSWLHIWFFPTCIMWMSLGGYSAYCIIFFVYCINCIWYTKSLRVSNNTLEENKKGDIRLDMRKLDQTFLLNPKVLMLHAKRCVSFSQPRESKVTCLVSCIRYLLLCSCGCSFWCLINLNHSRFALLLFIMRTQTSRVLSVWRVRFYKNKT